MTDKWEKILSHISCCKYLEQCEEGQLYSNLAEGEVYSKHFSCVIEVKLGNYR